MVDINHAILVGRLTRDAELKYTQSGQPVCKFSIAVNRRKKNGDVWEDEANFFDIVLWGRQGETLNRYLVKGKQVAIDGELRQDRWEQEGQKRSKVEIVATTLQLLGGGGYNSNNNSSGNSGSYNGNTSMGGQNAADNGGWNSGPAPSFRDNNAPRGTDSGASGAPVSGSARGFNNDDIPF